MIPVLFIFSLVSSTVFSGSSKNEPDGKFGPPHEISSGVNIHFATGHERDLDLITEAGLKFVRMDFLWELTEKQKGIYDWTAYKELTANLNARGLRALYILDYSNSLYEQEVESKDPITGEPWQGVAAPRTPGSVMAFATWAGEAAKQFKGNNIVWEIWNEPNITFWKPVPDVKNYINLAIATCKAIRANDPDAIIIGPATSQIPLLFIESFLASGILDYIDGVSVHPYRDYSEPPESAAREYKSLKEIIKKYLPENKKEVPVISSEWGYASATYALTPETQAAYIARMQLTNLLNGVPLSIWYDWKNDGLQPGNYEHNCGTVTNDLVPKPAYISVKTLNDQLDGFKLIKRIEIRNNDYVLLFKNDSGNSKLVAWTSEIPHTVELDGFNSHSCVDWSGNNREIKNDGTGIIIDLDGFPKYIALQ